MNNVNAKEHSLGNLGVVLELGKLPEDEKRSEAGFTIREREREKCLGFLRNKPWIKVQWP